VEETLYCGAMGIIAFIPITKKAPQTVQVNLSYTLGDSYCTQKQSSVSLLKRSLFKQHTDKNITIMNMNAVQLEYEFSNIHVLSIYRALTGDFELFIYRSENMNYFYAIKPEFVMSGDINTDHLTESYHK
jgi:hypothetical protein